MKLKLSSLLCKQKNKRCSRRETPRAGAGGKGGTHGAGWNLLSLGLFENVPKRNFTRQQLMASAGCKHWASPPRLGLVLALCTTRLWAYVRFL